MKNNLIKIIAAIFLYACVLSASGIKDKAFEIINSNFNSPTINIEKFELDKNLKAQIEQKVRQRFYQDYVYIYKIIVDGYEEGIAIIDNVIGKSMPITFMVIFNNQGNIISSSILKYREPYGGGVTSEDWQSQFNGKNSDSNFKVGEDVSTISGATISVNSVSTGIQKLAILFKSIKDEL